MIHLSLCIIPEISNSLILAKHVIIIFFGSLFKKARALLFTCHEKTFTLSYNGPLTKYPHQSKSKPHPPNQPNQAYTKKREIGAGDLTTASEYEIIP
jgi:hypothetical protein